MYFIPVIIRPIYLRCPYILFISKLHYCPIIHCEKHIQMLSPEHLFQYQTCHRWLSTRPDHNNAVGFFCFFFPPPPFPNSKHIFFPLHKQKKDKTPWLNSSNGRVSPPSIFPPIHSSHIARSTADPFSSTLLKMFCLFSGRTASFIYFP